MYDFVSIDLETSSRFLKLNLKFPVQLLHIKLHESNDVTQNVLPSSAAYGESRETYNFLTADN